VIGDDPSEMNEEIQEREASDKEIEKLHNVGL
jgi:hypothetical protein